MVIAASGHSECLCSLVLSRGNNLILLYSRKNLEGEMKLTLENLYVLWNANGIMKMRMQYIKRDVMHAKRH